MGRATILGSKGDGLYLIRPEYDWSKLDAELSRLNREDTDNEPLRQQLLLDIADQIVVVAQKEGALNEAIQIDKVQPSGETEPGRMVGGITSEDGTVLVDSVKIPDLPTVSSAVMDATVAFAIESKKLAALKQRRSEVEAGYIERQKRRDMLNAERDRITNSAIEAWCADYTLTLSPGQRVNTIEVPGYRLKGEPSMNIAPQDSIGSGRFDYGQLRSALTMSPETVFINAAIEAGHLKWRPRWRYGIITWISADFSTCNVELEQEYGRQINGGISKLTLNQQSTLSGVRIEYRCRQVFAVGDEVIVQFRSDTSQEVIGFRRSPKKCDEGGGGSCYVDIYSRSSSTSSKLLMPADYTYTATIVYELGVPVSGALTLSESFSGPVTWQISEGVSFDFDVVYSRTYDRACGQQSSDTVTEEIKYLKISAAGNLIHEETSTTTRNNDAISTSVEMFTFFMTGAQCNMTLINGSCRTYSKGGGAASARDCPTAQYNKNGLTRLGCFNSSGTYTEENATPYTVMAHAFEFRYEEYTHVSTTRDVPLPYVPLTWSAPK